ncbi:thioredoxin family protein [Plantactinospora sp. CA-294935]|uniref:thioredoxin family protein n=1 Tax=Plantactinospora sp. CA-294935 TaxID=3240012 RepID=UPI003D92F023
MSYVVPVTDATYRARVADSPTPVLLVFMPDGGDVRRAFAPVLAEVAQRLGDGLVVATVEVATNPVTTKGWGVTQTPTSVLLHRGIMQRVLLGVRPVDRLIEEIEQAVGPNIAMP